MAVLFLAAPNGVRSTLDVEQLDVSFGIRCSVDCVIGAQKTKNNDEVVFL